MVTPDEIGGVALFSALDAAQREQLSRVAADVSLAAGEYAAHEGAERALFAVLEGRIEPTRLVDGPASSRAGSASSSARTPRPRGCRPRSR